VHWLARSYRRQLPRLDELSGALWRLNEHMTIIPVGTIGSTYERWRATRITNLSSPRRVCVVVAGCLLAGLAATSALSAQDDDSRRDVSIAAHAGKFEPPRIEVRQNDLVKVTFTADDGPHSFNVDAYRIAKRARPGHPAVFEFRADQAGTFPYYCNLNEGDARHDMKGELVVRAR
jgi:plastocyanin